MGILNISAINYYIIALKIDVISIIPISIIVLKKYQIIDFKSKLKIVKNLSIGKVISSYLEQVKKTQLYLCFVHV